jgi:tetratricopeptide (TPR) repeat protein
MVLVNKYAKDDPRGAVQILDAVAPAAGDQEKETVVPQRQQLLERLVAREANDPDAATQLALLYESQHQLPKCEPILAPLADRLGSGEGARILGEVYSQQGKYDQAHPLLAAYVKERLERMNAAQEAYSNIQKQIFEQLKNGNAPGFQYQRFKSASEEQRSNMLREYFDAQLRDNAEYRTTHEELMKRMPVVRVALDLGIVELRRAQGLVDPAARRAELERAEKTFLSLRGVAGESAEYRLGQVYYWLGKPEQGRKLFDELLEKNNRATDALLNVAHMLNEVGLTADARKLAEEAYNHDNDQTKKYTAAHARFILREDLDDEILWLGRSNPNDPEVKASLCTARGNKAMTEGNDTEAISQLKQAMELYDRQPVTPSSLNNGAIPGFLLFRVTGEREVLDNAVARVDRALTMAPSDSILLSNAAHSVLEASVRDVIGSSLELKTLKVEGDLSLLSYLYRDKAGRDVYVERIRKNPGMAKALGYLDRLLVLAPKRSASYHSLKSVHGFTGDAAALRGLLKRLEDASPSTGEETRKALEYYQGKDDARSIKELKTRLERAEAVLAQSRRKSTEVEVSATQRATFAVAACFVVRHLSTLDAMGQTVDADRVVKLAEEADAASPSQGTRSAVVGALLLRASRTLAEQQPAYGAMLREGRRSLGPTYLIPVALSQEKLRKAVLANKDVQRAVELQVAANAKLGDEVGPWAWALLRWAAPEDAARVAAAVKKDEVGDLERSIDLRLMPFSAPSAYSAYWAEQLTGIGERQGPDPRKRCRELGVPIPMPE